MKKYKLIIGLAGFTIIAVFYCSLRSFAQGDATDALRYSVLSPQGTARSMGIGGALGSVGGDFSSLSVNPAGIGIYRSSEIMISPSLKVNSATGTYQGSSLSDNGSRFNIGNVGAVFTHAERGRRYKNSNWKSVSFGIGFNRLADFTKNYSYSGVNRGSTSSSGSEIYSVDANQYPSGVNQSNQLSYLGYQSYLLTDPDTGGYYHTVVDYNGGINQQRVVRERGGINEIALTLGGNYMESLLLGITVGIQSLDYSRTATYSESALTTGEFINYSATENYKVTGIGINAKLGAIYKFSDKFRIGTAIHTPTAYAMTDNYYASVVANTTSNGVREADGDQFNYSYSMTTPWKALASATAILGKLGFVTADYEVVDYSSTRMHFSDLQSLEYATNQAIKANYKYASNVRAGIELRLSPVSLRGGFGFYGSPYKSYTYNRYDVSGGIGFRFKRTFLDFSFVHSMYSSPEQPYVLPTDGGYTGVVVPTATIKNSINNVALTLGFKF